MPISDRPKLRANSSTPAHCRAELQCGHAFGMDTVGWLPVEPGGPRQAIGLEVKSSGGESFNLSMGEWRRAEAFHENGNGDRYAVLVVRRSKSGGPPSAMDLMTDPVALLATHQIRLDVDGYQVKYSSE